MKFRTLKTKVLILECPKCKHKEQHFRKLKYTCSWCGKKFKVKKVSEKERYIPRRIWDY